MEIAKPYTQSPISFRGLNSEHPSQLNSWVHVWPRIGHLASLTQEQWSSYEAGCPVTNLVSCVCNNWCVLSFYFFLGPILEFPKWMSWCTAASLAWILSGDWFHRELATAIDQFKEVPPHKHWPLQATVSSEVVKVLHWYSPEFLFLVAHPIHWIVLRDSGIKTIVSQSFFH